MSWVNFKADCRKCRQPMKPASRFSDHAIYCSACKQRAEITYSDTPVLELNFQPHDSKTKEMNNL